MSDEKNKVADKASEIARNIWLAGVGAYGKAVDEAQGRLEKAGVETPKLFRDLVKAGAALEDEAREAVSAGQSARHSVEERIHRVRENFSLQRPARGEDLLALHEKIDRLTRKVDDLANLLAEPGSARRARKTTGKKKPAVKKAPNRRAPAKKAPAKKAPAKKAPPARRKAAKTTGTTAVRRKT